jgi:hypothetical protein
MFKVTCIKCGETIREIPTKDATSICEKCAGELVDNMSTEELIAHAKVGWDALIDESTGYEKVRPKDALKKRYEQYRGKN